MTDTDKERQLLFRYHERNDREVAQRIREGETDFITGTGWALMRLLTTYLSQSIFGDSSPQAGAGAFV